MIQKTKKIYLNYIGINPYDMLHIIEFYDSLSINYNISSDEIEILSLFIDPGDFINNINSILEFNSVGSDSRIDECSFDNESNFLKLRTITDRIHKYADLVRYEFYDGVTGQFILNISSDKKFYEVYKRDNSYVSNQISRNRLMSELENLISLINPNIGIIKSLGGSYSQFADLAIYLYKLYQYNLLEAELKLRLENIWPTIQSYISHMQY